MTATGWILVAVAVVIGIAIGLAVPYVLILLAYLRGDSTR